MATDDSRTARQEAERYLANPRFHQSITVHTGPKYGEITISYADYGFHQDSNENGAGKEVDETGTPTILFTPGMFGSRYLGVFMHVFAVKHKVRVLVADRFGFGKTPDLPLEDRVDTWTAVVPKFLAALGVKHVALVSHSAGTIYNMNILWQCPQILHPIHPTVCFFAPFVDGACSQAPLIAALRGLPVFSFAHWNKLATFFAVKASVVTGASSGLLANFAKMVTPGNKEPSEAEKNMNFIEENYGLEIDTQVELEKAMTQGMFGEDTVGANSEALNCLKKGPVGIWGEAEDMQQLVSNVISRWTESPVKGREKLRVRVFFAESDIMSGKKGQEYFQECWKGKPGVGEDRGDCLDVKMRTIAKSDHDSVLSSVEALETVFSLIGESGR